MIGNTFIQTQKTFASSATEIGGGELTIYLSTFGDSINLCKIAVFGQVCPDAATYMTVDAYDESTVYTFNLLTESSILIVKPTVSAGPSIGCYPTEMSFRQASDDFDLFNSELNTDKKHFSYSKKEL